MWHSAYVSGPYYASVWLYQVKRVRIQWCSRQSHHIHTCSMAGEELTCCFNMYADYTYNSKKSFLRSDLQQHIRQYSIQFLVTVVSLLTDYHKAHAAWNFLHLKSWDRVRTSQIWEQCFHKVDRAPFHQLKKVRESYGLTSIFDRTSRKSELGCQ